MRAALRLLILLTALCLICGFSGCGGGGGGSSDSGGSGNNNIAASGLSGVAAAGSPIVGHVWLKDSLGAIIGPQATGADGGFSFSAAQIAGLTPPFFLEARGRAGADGCTLYSWASGPGTANINPLTNLAIGMACGNDPASAYSNAALNAAALQTAIARIRASLKSLLALFGAENTDFFMGACKADHSGLDAMFDVVSIIVTPGVRAVITDKAANAALINAALGDMAGQFLSEGDVAGLAGAEADMQGIAALFNKFIAAMNTKNAGSLDALLYGSADDPIPFVINNGLVRSVYLDYLIHIADNMAAAGKTIERIVFNVAGREPDGAYDITSVWVFSDGATTLNGTDLSQVPDRVIKDGNEWKFTGNYSVASTVCLQAGAIKTIDPSNQATYHSFLIFNVTDYTGWIDHAVFTVQGIAREFTKTKSLDNPTKFRSAYYIGDEETTGIENVIKASGRADFSFMLYAADGALLQAGKTSIYKAPPPSDTLLDQQALDPFFPWVGTTNNSHSIADLQPLFSGGGTYNFSYISPPALISSVIAASCKLTARDSGSNSAAFTAPILTQTGGTEIGSIPVSILNWPPTSATLMLCVTDIYGREFYTDWMYQ